MNLTSKRDGLKKVYTPIGVAFARMGIPPNLITLLSLFLGTISAYFFYQEKLLTAVGFLFLSGLFDLLDGVVARTNERASKFGAVFDWIADKWVDGFVLGAIGFAYGSPLVAITAVVVSMLHSFIKPVVYSEIGFTERVKGKIKDPLEGVGFFGRPETHIAVMLFALLERLNLPIGLEFGIKLITVLTLASLLLRITYLYRHYAKDYE
jgi:phosphatidylglycerophosphate synthase